jgi:DNA-binding NarL/FixJ family response regulator
MRPLETYLVEDSQVIRDSLIGTLEELLPLRVVGAAEDEASALRWLTQTGNHADLLIVDIFLKGGSGLGVLRSARLLSPRRTCGADASNWAPTGCSTSPTRSMR